MTTSTHRTTRSIGGPAPQVTPLDPAGRPVPLRDLWAGAPRCLVLVFVRQLG